MEYPWGNSEPNGNTTNWRKTGLGHIAPVGIFPENVTAEGIFDLCGNVWEWCRDWKDVVCENKAHSGYQQVKSVFLK